MRLRLEQSLFLLVPFLAAAPPGCGNGNATTAGSGAAGSDAGTNGDSGSGSGTSGDGGSSSEMNVDAGSPDMPGSDAATSPLPGNQIGYSTCPAPASGGTTYTIGLLDGSSAPSGPQTIAAFTHWNDLNPGDVVCIYGQSTPYAERLVLTRPGSDEAHRVRVVGVVQNGNEPVLTGKSATTAAAFNYGANYAENYEGGEVAFFGLTYGVSLAYVSVEGLTIEGATTAEVGGTAASPTYSVNTYADPSISAGAQMPWGCGSAGVNIVRADHISLVHNRIKDNDNGIFVDSNNGNTSSNILVAYNHIYGNGVYGEQAGPQDPGMCGLDAHGTYTEANVITYLGNRFGAPKQGEATNLLKDRSAGLVVAYNFFEPDGTLERTLGDELLVGSAPQAFGHILDMVESEVGLDSLGALYDNVSVYGNVFFDNGANPMQGTLVPLHFGGDQDNPGPAYRHHLHFYNNTVVSQRDDSSPYDALGWFEMETGTNVEAWNNIFYASTTTSQMFVLLDTYCYDKPCGTTSDLTQNWISPVWGTTGVNGTSAASPFADLTTFDVHLASADPTIVGNGQAGDSAYPANATTIPLEYQDFLATEARPFSKTTIDLGAYGYVAP